MTDLWQRFAEPPRSFSPVPLWWWSGDKVEAARLRWQLERLVAGGVFNVVVMNLAPTSPLYGSDADDPPFFSDAWWALFEGVCRDADELGVRVWLYDQIGFSGANFQGGIVREEPRFAGRWIERVEAARGCPQGGTPVATLDGTLYYAVERGFDYLDPAACRRLLETIHGRFEARAAHWFGSVIVGTFQDELPDMPTWSATFAHEFERRRGYDLVPQLAALWEDRGEEGERVRRDFHGVRGELAEEAFFRPLHEWHERRGLLCGVDQQEGARQGHPVAAERIYGEYLRTHRWFSAPGSDHHGDSKIHSSLAHHYGRERVWIEAFHSSGWGGTLEETFDWLLPWLGAGATLYDPHATYYSTRAGWWEWAPPATDWRQPYWPHYAHFARAVARLCAVLSWGSHDCGVGVLFPAATVQAGLRLDGAGPDAARADALYRALVGDMTWYAPAPGVLNRLARDFDVLDDDTVARASCERAGLVTAHETYRAIVLPGCTVLEAETARRLVEFVDAGGTLIAVGALPAGDDAAELRARFAAGAARFVEAPEAIAAPLAAVPAPVEAPVPTLVRRDAGTTVVFVPAAHPRVTETSTAADADTYHAWLRVRYDFDPDRYARSLDVIVRGVDGAPELWEPFSGARRRLDAQPVDGGVRVRVPFTDGPCALLVWGAAGDAEPAAARPHGEPVALDGPWDVSVETTLADDWGDLGAPGAAVVDAWELEHRAEDGDWAPVHATFGPRALCSGPAAPAELPELGAAEDDPRWRAAEWSPARGIHKDPVHLDTLGPSGRVPEEFLHFGRVAAGEAVAVRVVVRCGAPLATHLAVGAGAVKHAWLGGRPVPLEGAGYLAHARVELPAGATVLELRLVARETVERLRAHFAFVADLDGYLRPEWLRASGAVAKSSVVAFSTTVALPAAPVAATVLVGANGPCRVLVGGVEIGRQGGFDPYLERDVGRFQPYDLTAALTAGEQELRLELLDLGRTRPAAILDGLVQTPEGTVALRSDERWRAARDGVAVPLDLRLEQEGDPAFAHAWRRPHPLPGGAWLEPGRAAADAGAPLEFAAGSAAVPQRLRVVAPPGAERITVPLAAGCRGTIEVDGRVIASGAGALTGPLTGGAPRACEIRVEPAAGLSGGALLTGPISFTVGPGRMDLVDWQDAGLAGHSGAVRYRRRVDQPGVLDLGRVRGTAEVLVDGESAGVRVCAPYTFDLTGRIPAGGAMVEVVVLNTLAPHLDAVSPTPYVFPGQRRSGMLGPVTLREERT